MRRSAPVCPSRVDGALGSPIDSLDLETGAASIPARLHFTQPSTAKAESPDWLLRMDLGILLTNLPLQLGCTSHRDDANVLAVALCDPCSTI
jgi:hypothetical protein